MDERRCGFCEAVVAPFERQTFAGIPFAARYRCPSCSTRFDVGSRFGHGLLALAIGILTVVAVLPDQKFGSPADRVWILVVCVVQVIIAIGIVLRGRVNARRHPLVEAPRG